MRSSLEHYNLWRRSILQRHDIDPQNLDFTFSKDLIRFVLYEYCPDLRWEPTDIFSESDNNSFTPVVKLAVQTYFNAAKHNASSYVVHVFMNGKECYKAHQVLCINFRHILLRRPMSIESFLAYLYLVSTSTAYAYFNSSDTTSCSVYTIYKTIVRMRQLTMITDTFWTDFARECEASLITGTLTESPSIRYFVTPIIEDNRIETVYQSNTGNCYWIN
ncbi:hypothetical protein NPIL_2721 [Nephila pilipes]|uniref:Uncharacterized protein n=1 Tax=Nephila pilipes TaxID=299642 RepID=A0A8X6P0Q1_NEPPI|nr:hypothetical protein NPIL_2721 [Nephila pilipes]